MLWPQLISRILFSLLPSVLCKWVISASTAEHTWGPQPGSNLLQVHPHYRGPRWRSRLGLRLMPRVTLTWPSTRADYHRNRTSPLSLSISSQVSKPTQHYPEYNSRRRLTRGHDNLCKVSFLARLLFSHFLSKPQPIHHPHFCLPNLTALNACSFWAHILPLPNPALAFFALSLLPISGGISPKPGPPYPPPRTSSLWQQPQVSYFNPPASTRKPPPQYVPLWNAWLV